VLFAYDGHRLRRIAAAYRRDGCDAADFPEGPLMYGRGRNCKPR
jgi:hypothetical protein